MNNYTHINGTTYKGMLIQVVVNDVDLDITDAVITAVFKHKDGCELNKTFTIGNGIEVTDATGGEIKLLENEILEWKKGDWKLTITYVLASGEKQKYVYEDTILTII